MSAPAIRSVLIAALGGEGGGVLADWLVLCARQSGLAVQATSVPGVAQRTGATSYYLEFSVAPWPEGSVPSFALSPTPARVDVVVASELLEAARMMERGFVTPERTHLIASTSRVYTTLEKMQPHDGRFDPERVRALSQVLARESLWLDMAELTQQHRTAVSSIMLGALAGAGALPWSRACCEDVIRASGKGVEASLAGFAAAFAAAQSGPPSEAREAPARATAGPSSAPVSLAALPEALQTVAAHGVARCTDYQDAAYAREYLAQLQTLVQACPNPAPAHVALWQEAARHLALWMCFEDIARVADLKSRPERFAQVRASARAAAGEVVHITDHFKPGLEEIAAILPRALGQALAAHARPERHVSLHIRATSFWGFALLRLLAQARRWRRHTLRYHDETQARVAWWQAVCQWAQVAPAFATAVAGLPQVRKGYGQTQQRGLHRYARLWQTLVLPRLDAATPPEPEHTQALQDALRAALSDLPDPQNDGTAERPVLWLKPGA